MKAISCFDITNASRTARAFKLTINESYVDIITNESSWPADVIVRSWKFRSITPHGNDNDRSGDELNNKDVEGESVSPPDVSDTRTTKFIRIDTDLDNNKTDCVLVGYSVPIKFNKVLNNRVIKMCLE